MHGLTTELSEEGVTSRPSQRKGSVCVTHMCQRVLSMLMCVCGVFVPGGGGGGSGNDMFLHQQRATSPICSAFRFKEATLSKTRRVTADKELPTSPRGGRRSSRQPVCHAARRTARLTRPLVRVQAEAS